MHKQHTPSKALIRGLLDDSPTNQLAVSQVGTGQLLDRSIRRQQNFF